jgi:lipoyl(octanoyl) transferase
VTHGDCRMPPPGTWRLLCHAPEDGAWNMAVDEAVADAVGRGHSPPTLRWYGWRRPTVSLGRLQRVGGGPLAATCARLDIPMVRRPTGGRAVLHAAELTYSLALPAANPLARGPVQRSYAAIAEGLLEGLRRLGVRPADGETTGREGTPRSAACFQTRTLPAILVEGRKLLGSAQRRWTRGLLQHGSLLLEFDLGLHQSLFPDWPREEAAQRVTWLGALLPVLPSRAGLIGTLTEGMAAGYGVRFEPGELSGAEAAHARELAVHPYGDPGWTLRI